MAQSFRQRRLFDEPKAKINKGRWMAPPPLLLTSFSTRLTVRRVTTIIFHLPKNDAEAIELHLGVQLGFFLCMYAIMAIYL